MVATQPTNQYVIRISYMTTNPNCISKCIDVIFTFANNIMYSILHVNSQIINSIILNQDDDVTMNFFPILRLTICTGQ